MAITYKKPNYGTVYKKPTYKSLSGSASSGNIKPATNKSPVMTPEQAKYVKSLGYTPSELPSFFNERKDQNFLESTLGNAIDRLGSGFNKAYANLYSDAARNVGGKDFGAQVKYAIPGFTPLSFVKNYIEGVLGNVDYSKNVSAIREIMDAPAYQKDVIEPQKQAKLPFEIGGLKTQADVTQNPALQYGGQFVASLADPVSNEIVGGLMKGVGVLGKKGVQTVGKTKVGGEVFNGVKTFIKDTLEKSPTLAEGVARATKAGLTTEAKDIMAVNKMSGHVNTETAGIFLRAIKGEKLDRQAYQLLNSGLKEMVGEKATTKVFTILDDLVKGKVKVTQPELQQVFESISNPSFVGKLTPTAEKIKTIVITVIGEESKKLFEAGKITKETYTAMVDKYLPFLYKNESKLGKAPTLIAKGGEAFDAGAGNLKARFQPMERIFASIESPNVTKVIPADQVVELKKLKQSLELEKILSEVSGDTSKIDNIYSQVESIVGNLDSVNYKLAQNIGLIEDAGLASSVGLMNASESIRKGKMIQDFAKSGSVFDSIDEAIAAFPDMTPTMFKELPNTAMFGELKGKVVPVLLERYLKGELVSTDPSELVKLLEGSLTIWKSLKLFAPGNPATGFRNWVTGFFQAEMGGYNSLEYAKAWNDMAKQTLKGGKEFDLAVRYGLVRSPNNLNVAGEVSRTVAGKSDLGNKVANKVFGGVQIGASPFGTGRKVFTNVDNVNRLAVFKMELAKGTKALEAAQIANKVMYDYSRLPEWISLLDKRGIPFVRFAYSAMVAAGETLIKNPEFYIKGTRLKNWIEAGAGPDEALPDYMQKNRGAYVKLPELPILGKNQYLDLSSVVPYSQGLTNESVVPKDPVSLARYIALQNPFVKTIAELTFNKKLFNDSPIVLPGVSDAGANRARGEYFLNALGPSGILSQPGLKTVQGLVAGENQNLYGKNQDLVNSVLRYTIGIRPTAVDPAEQLTSNVADAQREVDAYNQRITSLLKKGNSSGSQEVYNIRKQRDAFIAKSPYKGYIKNKAK